MLLVANMKLITGVGPVNYPPFDSLYNSWLTGICPDEFSKVNLAIDDDFAHLEKSQLGLTRNTYRMILKIAR